MGIKITAELDIDDLVEQAVDDLNHEALFDLVKQIDARVADWSFTLRLARYFECQKKVHAEECKAEG